MSAGSRIFMPCYLVTSLTSAALAVIACFRLGEPGGVAMLTGGAVYVLGMFAVTAVFNVPLNDALAAADPASAEGTAVGALPSAIGPFGTIAGRSRLSRRRCFSPRPSPHDDDVR
jgi:hypothetical protein